MASEMSLYAGVTGRATPLSSDSRSTSAYGRLQIFGYLVERLVRRRQPALHRSHDLVVGLGEALRRLEGEVGLLGEGADAEADASHRHLARLAGPTDGPGGPTDLLPGSP